VRTPKKTMRDTSLSCGIPMVFLFKLEINLVEMIVDDDLLENQNLMFSLKLQKKNRIETRMVNDFLVIS
jgi:hypothetical protein